MTSPHEERIARLHREAPLTDVHVHPSLNRYLFGQDFWQDFGTGRGFNPLLLRAGYPYLSRGGVGVIWAAHYVPESEIFHDCEVLRFVKQLVPPLVRLAAADRFELLMEMMDAFERSLAKHADLVAVAHSAEEVRAIRRAGKLAVVHSVEGAHALGNDPDNVDRIAARGVATLTLTHFFYNWAFAQAQGIPDHMLGALASLSCRFDFGGAGQPPVTPYGYQLLEKLQQTRIIVDVCHVTPEARREVYRTLGTSRPIIASHAGLHAFQPLDYNLGDADLAALADSGGAMGIILMPDWLQAGGAKTGLESFWRTIDHVRQRTGSFDHLMIGTDLDGFTDPPDDCYDASMLGRITALMLDRGVDEADVKKVLGGNAQRILETGWGPPA